MALSAPAADAHAGDPRALESPALSEQTRLLVIAPHPDDETIACGMLIQRVLAAGGEVHVLLLTAGDNNPWPQRWLERRLTIRSDDRQRWGRRRHSELQSAIERLGVPTHALQALDWPDLGITNVLLTHADGAIATLADAVGAFQPTIIALPSLADRHPDHGAAHVLIRLALALGQGSAARMLTYLIHGGVPTAAFIEVGGSEAHAAIKRHALAAHDSQTALSGRRMYRLAGRPEHFVEVGYDALSRVPGSPGTALPWRPPGWLKSRLQLSVADRSGVHTWRWRDAPLRRADDGTYHLALPANEHVLPRFVRLACDLPTPWIFDHWGWCEP
jgi:N-acetyl-1-D-myo-inositol-2-amino-2-deoxy-alpha-D-glucopyranoside deacetylase